ncbi:SDR family NAD(P)-dependent oxidoreductase [Roseobacter sp. HKCCA0434]|uniref:SDR family NAD(P)-dependent oxidoreductase n=1 Tax=Roseobacter sp. HKCCA0434 TaxID=3079297 RepID=UPI002905D9EC|nr:SDR family oxidoreductase [Roseobacter sp. HKCCA0434]
MGSLAGKSVIVTGAASGVGLAIARKFRDEGARVMMADIEDDKLEAERKVLCKDNERVRCFTCDLREKLSIANLMATTIDNFDRVDVLVNASRQVISSDPLDAQGDVFDALMQQNVKNALRLSQVVAKKMIAQSAEEPDVRNAGAIVNVTSISAQRTLPELLAYSVSCAALDQMTRSLAVALAPKGVRVNAIALGGVMTGHLKEALREREELRDELTAVTPLGRIGDAEEAAEAALFLASDRASFVTGQILAVDGGRTNLDPLDAPSG